MINEILDKHSGAILFKKDDESLTLERLCKEITDLQKKITVLEKKVTSLEKANKSK